MKWKNPGMEYDGLYHNILKKEKFYLFGAGHDGKIIHKIISEKFKIKVTGFIDNDLRKVGQFLEGIKIYSFNEIDFGENVGVIVTIAPEILKPIEKQLEDLGLKKDKDYFHYYEFVSVYAAYRFEKVFLPSVSFIPTTVCNLRCKACLNFTPYIKKFENRTWEEVKRDIDVFFQVVDFVNVFHVSGGEPMLYEYYPKLLRYLSEKYGDKIGSLETVTNGTVIPTEQFMKVYKDCAFTITVDDYTDVVTTYADRIKEIKEMLEKVEGRGKFIIRKYDTWIDLAPFRKNIEELDDSELIKKYDLCHVPWSEYKNGKLTMCNYAAFACTAGIRESAPDDEYFDLSKYSKEKLKELVEFRLGYSKKGYTEFCRRCAGYLEINPYKVAAGEQMEGNKGDVKK